MRRRTLRVLAALVTVAVLLVVPGTSSATTGRWDITTPGETVVLTEDHVGHFVIGADNVTLDCAGFRIDATGTGWSGVDITVKSGVTVKNCTITGALFGIGVAGPASDLTFTGNTLLNNTSTGIQIGQTVDAIVSGNTATDNGDSGILLIESSGIDVSNNTAADNGNFGIGVAGPASDLTFTGNKLLTNGLDGLRIGDTARSVISGNLSEGNTLLGFATLRDVDAELYDNVARNNGYEGIALGEGTVDAVVIGNTSAHNEAQGFSDTGTVGSYYEGNTAVGNLDGFLIGWFDSVTLVGNVANGNARFGFTLHHGNDATANWNRAVRNGDVGLQFSALVTGEMVGNRSQRNLAGIQVWQSTGITLTDNAAIKNDQRGITLAFGGGHTATRNTARNNGHDGFDVQSSSDNLIVGNTVNHNGLQGFLAFESTIPPDGTEIIPAINNLFQDNEACRNGLEDARDDSTDSTWIDNDFCTTFNVP
jgi:parallel beta-helix repeat protein